MITMLSQSVNIVTPMQTSFNHFDDLNASSSLSNSYSSSSSGDGCIDLSKHPDFAYQYVMPYSEKVVRLGILPIIVLVGLTLNLWFLLAVARVPSMRTSLNCYLVNLACADIMILSTNMVDKVIQYFVDPVQSAAGFGVEGCVLITVFKWWGFFTSLTLITVITFEKFYAVCHPLTHKRLNHKKRRVTLCSVAWLGAFIAACVEIPTAIKVHTQCVSQWPSGTEFDRFPNIIERCHPLNLTYAKFCQVYTSIPFFIGMFTNVYLYIRIYLAVRKTDGWHQQVTRSSHVNSGANSSSNQYRVARMLIINGLVYFICLAPNQAILLVQFCDATPTSQLYGALIRICAVLINLNSCMNPIVYCLTNPRYRLAYQMALTCTKHRPRGIRKDGFDSIDSSRTRTTSFSMNRISVNWKSVTSGRGVVINK